MQQSRHEPLAAPAVTDSCVQCVRLPAPTLQGSGQEKAGTNWGDGFVTDKAVLAEKSLSDPNEFFTALVAKPYRNRVVLSPHLYGPSLSNNTYHIGEPQLQAYSNSWGVLQKQGYCAEGGANGTAAAACQKFPVAIGETGSNFTSSALDAKWFDSLVKFMNGQASGHQTTKFNRWFCEYCCP